MRGRRLTADVVVANTAISAALSGEAAMDLLHDMKGEVLQPDVFSYSGVLDSFAVEARWQDSVALIQDMVHVGLGVGAVALSAPLPKAPWRRALRLLKTARRSHTEPDEVLCGAAIGSLEQSLEWRQALNFLRGMRLTALRLSDVTVSSSILICAGARRWVRALWLLEGIGAAAASSYALILGELEQSGAGPESLLMSRLAESAFGALPRKASARCVQLPEAQFMLGLENLEPEEQPQGDPGIAAS
ncbi:unnamed protein product [Effrenium voratum]|uniref:Pentatricopeptide repeat-containing protein n=1 Tax=Effrenium voratum TaxID=2562239 RepID=A0AA36NIK9_9DINO|nr:unnamed protein product [Effrenium voratum]